MYKFFEVFTSLRLPEDIKDYFEEVEVIKVAKTSTNTLVKVYLKSSRMIHKQIIYKAEEALKKQVFRMKNMDVRIIDRYELSKQYSPKKIMDIYYDSILFELEKYWTLEYSLLRTSKWVFEDEDKLVLIFEDSFLAQAYAKDLKSYFEKVFMNRFGFEIDVENRYVKKAANQYEEENAYQLQLLVKAIEDNGNIANASNTSKNSKTSKIGNHTSSNGAIKTTEEKKKESKGS